MNRSAMPPSALIAAMCALALSDHGGGPDAATGREVPGDAAAPRPRGAPQVGLEGHRATPEQVAEIKAERLRRKAAAYAKRNRGRS